MQALMSVEDLAEYLGKPVKTIYEMNHRGTAPPRIRVGRHVRYRLADVEAWLSAHVVRD